jgi:membrane protein implicated in regulation of membrane protease activity
MQRRKPAWWSLHLLLPLLAALLVLAGWTVPSGGWRLALELAVVCAVYGLMLLWRHANRGALARAEWESIARDVKPRKFVAPRQRLQQPNFPVRVRVHGKE